MSETTEAVPPQGPEKATYTHDGDPANLAAAAHVALSWLDAALASSEVRRLIGSVEDVAKLARTRRYLYEFLGPCMPAVVQPAPRKFPEAVAEIVVSGRIKAPTP